jgi:hypothetical protein
MRAVKSALAFLLLAFSLSACNTLATRRDLYAPTKPAGLTPKPSIRAVMYTAYIRSRNRSQSQP